jgi:SAM-dependent methyltransferase
VNAEKQWTFDGDLTRAYTKVRQQFIAEFLEPVRHQLDLVSALDLGCGVGYFSKFLSDMGFRVVAVDGREENAAEGQRRHPEIKFLARNAEDPALPDIGRFNFVLCVGLLYHLENPFRAVRNLYALTEKVLLLESMCTPGEDASLQLLDESHDDNQGLNYVAFYPTEPCLVKMLYRAGFPFVYRFQRLPENEQFTSTLWRGRSRTFLAASKIPMTAPNLVLAKELIQPIVGSTDPWTTKLSRSRNSWTNGLFKLRVLTARLLRLGRRKVNPASSGGAGAK